MSVKRTAKRVAVPVHDVNTESGRIAHEIVLEFKDLAPSVNKIMAAELSERGRLHAIDAFRGSLSTPADPMRDPRNAIAAGQSVDAVS